MVPEFEWPFFADDIDAILRLKEEKKAVILAHNYQTPEIFHCVADIKGDSLALAREAEKVDAEVIVAATPIDLAGLIQIDRPVVRARYEYAEYGKPALSEFVDDFLRRR